MTIASALTALNQDITSARTAIKNKGGTVTSGGGSSQLATDIATIPTGGSSPVITSLSVTPTTSQQTITAPSGTDGYSPVNVAAVTASIDQNIVAENIKKDVTILSVTGTYEGSGGGGSSSKYGTTVDTLLGDIDSNGILQFPTTQQTPIVFSGLRELTNNALYCKYMNSDIPSISFPNLTQINADGSSYKKDGSKGFALYGLVRDSKCKSIDLGSLVSISSSGNYGSGYTCAYMAYNSEVESCNLQNLETVLGSNTFQYAFGYSKVKSLRFNKLTNAKRYCFAYMCFGCEELETVIFDALYDISSIDYVFNSSSSNTGAFNSCPKLKNVYFYGLRTTSFNASYKSKFKYMNDSTTGKTYGCTFHFPSNLSTKVAALSGYPTFGGNANYITIAFDLPATS